MSATTLFLSSKGSCHNGDANMLERVATAAITPSAVPRQVACLSATCGQVLRAASIEVGE